MCVTHFIAYVLYHGGLEWNLQHLRGMPVFLHSLQKTRPVVLNREGFCPPGDIWQFGKDVWLSELGVGVGLLLARRGERPACC